MKGASDPWSGFWRDEPEAASGATLANLPRALQQRLDAPWQDLARALPAKTKVLDLATGGGIVLELLRMQRSDLQLTGVDAASPLPKRRGMMLKGDVALDRLPFADDSFGGITSRFGIEYGDIEAGAAEAGRVLRTGGQLCFLIHHDGSEVVRHNRARRGALHWAAHESGWVEKARSVANARRMLAMPTPSSFRSAPSEATALHPGQSVAWEFLTGLGQLLDAGAAEAQILQLVVKADGELARLDALLAAACGTDRLTRMTDALARAGITLDPLRTVDEPGGAPLAWHITGRKS